MSLVAITVPLSRSNPIVVPRRDLVVGAGGFTLRVQLAEADRHDAALLNLRASFARLRVRLTAERPYGCLDYGWWWGGALSTTTLPYMATARDWIDIPVAVPSGFGPRMIWTLLANISNVDHEPAWGVLQLSAAGAGAAYWSGSDAGTGTGGGTIPGGGGTPPGGGGGGGGDPPSGGGGGGGLEPLRALTETGAVVLTSDGREVLM